MKKLLSIAIMALIATSASARIATDFFLGNCDKAFTTLSLQNRAELVKYYEAKLPAKTSGKAGGQSTELIEADDEHLVVSTSSASSDALYVVPVGKRDTVLVVIHSVNLPAKDCSVEFFNKDWRKFISPKFFQEIELNDWILPNSPQNLVTLLKESALFVPASMTMRKITDEKGRIRYFLEASHSLESFLPKHIFDEVKAILRPSITFQYKSSRWQKVK